MGRILILITAFSFSFSLQARDLDALYEKSKFKVGEKKFSAFVADNRDRRNDGLMFVKTLPEDTGMLFVFEQEQILSFWMKNTLIPLSIGFFDAKGVLVDVQEMEVGKSLVSMDIPSYSSRKPAVFALEMDKGWFTKNKIKNGSKLRLISKTSSQLLRQKLPDIGPDVRTSGSSK